MQVRPKMSRKSTVNEAKANECQSHVDVSIARILEGEETVGQEGICDQEWEDIKAKEEKLRHQEVEVNFVLVHWRINLIIIFMPYDRHYKQMTEVFEVCETSFYNSLRAAQKNLRHPNPTILQLTQASEALKQATQELNKMEIQYNINRQPQVKSKIDLFKEQLRTYKKELTRAENKLKEQHVEQNSGPLFDGEEMEKGINPLIEAKRQMYENEQISNEVSNNLKRNNQVLIKNINRMGDINNQLTVAHKLLNSIKNKLRKNKLVMWGTLGVLALILAVVVYSYLGGSSASTTTVVQPATGQ